MWQQKLLEVSCYFLAWQPNKSKQILKKAFFQNLVAYLLANAFHQVWVRTLIFLSNDDKTPMGLYLDALEGFLAYTRKMYLSQRTDSVHMTYSIVY